VVIELNPNENLFNVEIIVLNSTT